MWVLAIILACAAIISSTISVVFALRAMASIRMHRLREPARELNGASVFESNVPRPFVDKVA